LNLAHNIKGTAGSLGLSQLCTTAGGIEELLNSIDPAHPAEQQLWFKVITLIQEIEFWYQATTSGFKLSQDHQLGIDRPLIAPPTVTADTNFKDSQAQPDRVLIVGDKALTTELSSTLSKQGMLVQSLNNAIEVFDVLVNFRPNLLLLDATLPGLSGYDLCRTLRSKAEWRDLPVIFLTAQAAWTSRAAIFQSGGNEFVLKPVVPQELLSRVTSQLSLKKQVSEIDSLSSHDFVSG